jgi:hypothetical protein
MLINVKEYQRGNLEKMEKRHTRRRKTKQKNNAIFVGSHYTQANTNNVNKTWTQNCVISVRQITWFRWNVKHWTSGVKCTQQKLQSICAVLTCDPQPGVRYPTICLISEIYTERQIVFLSWCWQPHIKKENKFNFKEANVSALKYLIQINCVPFFHFL